MKKIRLFPPLVVAGACLISLLTGCSGSGGSSAGAAGHSVVTAVRNSAPLNVCLSGGISVDAGIDTNGNGVLDPSEVTSTQYVCNGANGTNGTNGLTMLVSVTSEPSGTNCSAGGSKVSAGPDTNGNGSLDAAEITSSDYICNGTNGTNGNNGTGGTNGSNGFNSLVSIVSVVSPTTCAYGGSMVTSGIDANRNNILDPTEVTTTTYVCNGEPGSIGPAGPGVTWVTVTGTSVQAVSNTGYMANNPTSQVTVTLPASPVMGDIVQVSGVGAGGWNIAQNAGQSVITRDLPGTIGAQWTARGSNRNWQAVASSADGTKLVAAVMGGQLYTSTDSGVTWTARDVNRAWFSVASSADGMKLVAADYGGLIYTSTDSGVTWSPQPNSGSANWRSVASSADGTNLVAAALGGQIYTSTDSGTTWAARDSVRDWVSVVSSADGTKLAAAVRGGQIYNSKDSGAVWYPRDTNRWWSSLASSADGTKLVAGIMGGQIYTSTDSGVTWIAREPSGNWLSLASSADGTRLVGGLQSGQIGTSIDSGVTWTLRNAVSGSLSSFVASSADGTKLTAAASSGQIYTSIPTAIQCTAVGITGSISGAQYDAIELQYIGNNTFTVLSSAGYLLVQ